MSSPIGHSLVGLAIGAAALLPAGGLRGLGHRLLDLRWPLLACMVLANLPDLDYLPGLLTGELNRFHHHITHTLGFVLLATLGVWLLARWRGAVSVRQWVLLGFLLVGSHLAVDLLTADGSEPYGIMALWPLTDARMLSPVSLFPAFKKDYFLEIFDPRNLRPVCFEVLWCGGLLVVVLCLKVGRRPPALR